MLSTLFQIYFSAVVRVVSPANVSLDPASAVRGLMDTNICSPLTIRLLFCFTTFLMVDNVDFVAAFRNREGLSRVWSLSYFLAHFFFFFPKSKTSAPFFFQIHNKNDMKNTIIPFPLKI